MFLELLRLVIGHHRFLDQLALVDFRFWHHHDSTSSL
jgi:hypothetical protein